MVIFNRTSIEEKIDLQNKIRKVSRTLQVSTLNIDIDKATMAQLKGWLFEIYSKLSNIEACNNINKRTITYRNKINKGISKEGYVLRERMLQLEDKFSICYESNRLETR